MDKQIKQRWIDALRSGDYSQGIGRLHNPKDNSFCCLGVLCDLYIKDHSDSAAWSFGPSVDEEAIDAAEGYLPGEVIDWADLNDSVSGDVPVIQDDGVVVSLTELNDIGASFQRIARYIESSIDPDKDEESEDNSSWDDEISSEERNACDYYNERYSYPNGD